MTLPRQHARRPASSRRAAMRSPQDVELAVLIERLNEPDHHVRPAVLQELGAFADATPALRPMVVEALCAWLRSPWDVEDVPRSAIGAVPKAGAPEEKQAREPEVRRAGMALLAHHLRDPNHASTWAGLDLDLAGAVLAGADLSGCWFTGGRIRLEGAWCIEGRLCLAGAHMTGGHLSLRHWTSGQGNVDFSRASITGGVVTLAGAVLDRGSISFAGSVVDGGVVTFTEAWLCGGTLDLSGVTVTRGLLSLADTRVTGGQVRLVDARLLGGITAFRDTDVPADVLITSGAEAYPGALLR